MRTRIGKVLVTGAAVSAAVTFSATSAFAATTATTTFSVSPGGSYTAAAGKTILTDNTTKAALTCASASAKGVLKKGTHLAGKDIGTITSTGFNKCTGPLNLHFTVKQSGTWDLTITKFSTANGGVATGFISNVKASLSGTGCQASVAGATDATYSNKTGELSVKPVAKSGHVLTVSGVKGCAGLIKNGNTTSFVGSYTVKPKQKIT